MNSIITEENMKLAEALARDYAKDDDELFDELRAEGYLALTVAASRFDPSRNVKFSTYAYYWIKKFILAYIDGHSLSALSLDEVISSDEGYDITLGDMLEDDMNVENEAIKNIEIEEMMKSLKELDEKEQDIIIRHYGLHNTYPETLEEIAESYGVSKQSIHKTEKKALTKLRNKIK